MRKGQTTEYGDDTRNRILKFISDFQDENGFCPSMREIMGECKISSLSLVSFHLDVLEEQNKIKRTDGIARSIVLCD